MKMETPNPIDMTGQQVPDHLCRMYDENMEGYYAARQWFGKLRCFLDGQDVTDLATECDIDRGWVRMYQKDFRGHFAMRGPNPVEFIRFGKIEVVPLIEV